MLGTSTDWVGIGTAVGIIITSIFSGWATILGLRVHKEVKNPNGSTTGQAVEDIHAAVSTPPGQQSIGVIASDVSDVVKQISGTGEAPHAAGAAEPTGGGQ